MEILQVASQLRPGTAWVVNIDKDGNYFDLRQAEDGTPRVSVPTPEELAPLLQQPDPKAKPTVEDQLNAIWQVLAQQPAALTPEASAILEQVQPTLAKGGAIAPSSPA